MTDAKDEASQAARALVAHRWGSQVVERAARTVIERADELPLALRAELHSATRGKENVADD
jgi:hypothetical protein